MVCLYSGPCTALLSGEQTFGKNRKKKMNAVTQTVVAYSKYSANLQHRPPSKHDFSHPRFLLLPLSLCQLQRFLISPLPSSAREITVILLLAVSQPPTRRQKRTHVHTLFISH